MFIDLKDASIVLGLLLMGAVPSWFLGASSVTDADRLAAANDVIHKVVRVATEPSESLVVIGERNCRGEGQNFDSCMEDFLSNYADHYVVNLVTGEYRLLGRSGSSGVVPDAIESHSFEESE